jgi:hypothetical protein
LLPRQYSSCLISGHQIRFEAVHLVQFERNRFSRQTDPFPPWATTQRPNCFLCIGRLHAK